MAVVDSATLKGYFNTGDKPTEAQYVDLIDTLFDQGTTGGSAPVIDESTSGNLTSRTHRIGGTATVLANSGSGEYTLTIQTDAYPLKIDIDGDGTVLSAGQLTIKVNNAANSENLYFDVAIIDKDDNSQIDLHARGIVPDQPAATANETTISLPNMSGFSSGYKILLR